MLRMLGGRGGQRGILAPAGAEKCSRLSGRLRGERPRRVTDGEVLARGPSPLRLSAANGIGAPLTAENPAHGASPFSAVNAIHQHGPRSQRSRAAPLAARRRRTSLTVKLRVGTSALARPYRLGAAQEHLTPVPRRAVAQLLAQALRRTASDGCVQDRQRCFSEAAALTMGSPPYA